MLSIAYIRQNWKFISLLIICIFAGSPLFVGLVFPSFALQYFSTSGTVMVLGMIAVVMGFSRVDGAKGSTLIEYAVLITAWHIIGGVAFCLDDVPMLEELSSACMFVFMFMAIVILAKVDTLK